MDKPHKKLEVWKLSMEIAVEIYQLCKTFPSFERFGLGSQMCRSAVSIPSNIAEGAGRNTKKEFVNFLHIAQGSLSELDTQLELGKLIGYVEESKWAALDSKLNKVDKMLTGLIKSQKVKIITRKSGEEQAVRGEVSSSSKKP